MEQQNEKWVNEIPIFVDIEWLDFTETIKRLYTESHLKIYYPFLSRFRSTCIVVIWKLQIIFYSAGNCFPVTFSFSASPQTIQLVWEQTQSLSVKGDYFFYYSHKQDESGKLFKRTSSRICTSSLSWQV